MREFSEMVLVTKLKCGDEIRPLDSIWSLQPNTYRGMRLNTPKKAGHTSQPAVASELYCLCSSVKVLRNGDLGFAELRNRKGVEG